MRKKVIILSGPPGAGKGTQADFIAERFGMKHFDVGKYFRNMIERGDPLMTPELIGENRKGILLDPRKFLELIEKNIKEWADAGTSIVFSGQPRTKLEAFGDAKLKGFIDFLVELYGKENVIILKLNIPEHITVERNSKRLVCTKCKAASNAQEIKTCSSCGGKLYRRKDDEPEAIKIRLKQYNDRTNPVFEELKKREFKIIDIDGTPAPEEVFESIKRHLQ